MLYNTFVILGNYVIKEKLKGGVCMVYQKEYVGRVLKRDIFGRNGAVLLPVHKTLTEIDLMKLINHNIYIEEQDLFDLNYFDLNHTENNNHENLKDIILNLVDQANKIFDDVKSGQNIPMMTIRETIVPSVLEITKHPNIADIYHLLSSLHNKNEYTYFHSVAVSVLSTLIGKWINLSEKDLSILTIGALLHDIGKARVPDDILDKPGKLSSEEFEEIKKHTLYGYNLIKKTVGASPRIALIALQHHERENEKGYPLGLNGEKIDILSKIVAIADIYHAMTSDRVYHQADPFYVVLQQMSSDVFGKLEPKIMTIFLKRTMDMLLGCRVKLTDDRIGKIILINPYNPIKPYVQLENNEVVDLSSKHNINIDKILYA